MKYCRTFPSNTALGWRMMDRTWDTDPVEGRWGSGNWLVMGMGVVEEGGVLDGVVWD